MTYVHATSLTTGIRVAIVELIIIYSKGKFLWFFVVGTYVSIKKTFLCIYVY